MIILQRETYRDDGTVATVVLRCHSESPIGEMFEVRRLTRVTFDYSDGEQITWTRDPATICSDCGHHDRPIHPDSDAQRGEPICTTCVREGAFD